MPCLAYRIFNALRVCVCSLRATKKRRSTTFAVHTHTDTEDSTENLSPSFVAASKICEAQFQCTHRAEGKCHRSMRLVKRSPNAGSLQGTSTTENKPLGPQSKDNDSILLRRKEHVLAN